MTRNLAILSVLVIKYKNQKIKKSTDGGLPSAKNLKIFPSLDRQLESEGQITQ